MRRRFPEGRKSLPASFIPGQYIEIRSGGTADNRPRNAYGKSGDNKQKIRAVFDTSPDDSVRV
jgi:hypothetical protein